MQIRSMTLTCVPPIEMPTATVHQVVQAFIESAFNDHTQTHPVSIDDYEEEGAIGLSIRMSGGVLVVWLSRTIIVARARSEAQAIECLSRLFRAVYWRAPQFPVHVPQLTIVAIVAVRRFRRVIDIDALSVVHPEFVRSARTHTSICRVQRGNYTTTSGRTRPKVITTIVFRMGSVFIMGATLLDEVAEFDMLLLETISPFFGAPAAQRVSTVDAMSEVEDESSSGEDVEMTDVSADMLRLQIE